MFNRNSFYRRRLRKILALQPFYQKMSNEELRNQTNIFKARLAEGISLRKILPEVYAVAAEASERVLHMRPYPVQIIGAIAMEYNNVVEMKTGEGKTLTAAMPMYLHGLTGPGNFLITANDYLANRDADQMGKVYRFLGLSVAAGVAVDEAHEAERDKEKIYRSDIVYTTNSGLGFDYLFDHLADTTAKQYMHQFNFALLDEADAVLLDTAQTPLIISGAPRVQSNLYKTTDTLVKAMVEELDYKKSDDTKNVWFTEEGLNHIEQYFGIEGILSNQWKDLYRHLILALKVNTVMKLNRDYIVNSENEIALIDTANGRELQGMKLESGLHQAIEAKEGVKVTPEQRSMGSITYQNLFRMFKQLAGMTGTASTDASEFMEVYRLAVYKVPTNRPNIRIDRHDHLFITNKAKLLATIEVVKEAYQKKRPVLIETGSLELSNLYSQLLLRERIPHNLLNARSASIESEIVATAGQKGIVTVATSMAGRGTDIQLGEGVQELGGLLVLGTERMDNPRVDNQLRGRAGRQGDPGESVFYVSLEDKVVVENGPKKIRKYVEKHENKQNQLISRHSHFHGAVGKAQKTLKNKQRQGRFQTLQYDDILRVQRNKIYEKRQEIMTSESLGEQIDYIFGQVVDDLLNKLRKRQYSAQDVVDFIYQNVNPDFTPPATSQKQVQLTTKKGLLAILNERLKFQANQLLSPMQVTYFERMALLRAIDVSWIEQLDSLHQLRVLSANKGRAGADPIFEYQKEARASFQKMDADLNIQVLRNLLCATFIIKPDGKVDMDFS